MFLPFLLLFSIFSLFETGEMLRPDIWTLSLSLSIFTRNVTPVICTFCSVEGRPNRITQAAFLLSKLAKTLNLSALFWSLSDWGIPLVIFTTFFTVSICPGLPKGFFALLPLCHHLEHLFHWPLLQHVPLDKLEVCWSAYSYSLSHPKPRPGIPVWTLPASACEYLLFSAMFLTCLRSHNPSKRSYWPAAHVMSLCLS